MTRKSHHISAFLLGVCLIPTLIFISLQAARTWVKFEMRENIEQQQLQELIVHKLAIHWVENEKELTINGILFDVSDFKNVGADSIWVKGIFDYQEQAIEEKADALLNSNNKEAPLLVKKLAAWQLYFTEDSITIQAYQSSPQSYAPANRQEWIQPFVEVNTPPPKIGSMYC